MNLYKFLKYNLVFILWLNIAENTVNIVREGYNEGIYILSLAVILLNLTLISIQGGISELILYYLNKLGFNTKVEISKKVILLLFILLSIPLLLFKNNFLVINLNAMMCLIQFNYILVLGILALLYASYKFLKYKRILLEGFSYE